MFTVPECKIIWRSLKDAVRYRKNKIARTADGTDEPRDEFEEYELDYNWEFSDCMSFLMNASSASALAKRPRRYLLLLIFVIFYYNMMHCHRMEPENSQTSTLRISSINSVNNSTGMDTNISIDCNDDISASESSCSYTVRVLRLIELFVSVVNSITQFPGPKERTRR